MGPYKLTATLTWKISWEGSGNTGGELGEATFTGEPREMTVQEIQSIVTRR